MVYRAGVVGIGRVGRNHAEAFLDADGIELAAIADVDERIVDDLGDRWDVPVDYRYHDHLAMLASERLDVVSIATPETYHHRHVLEAVEAASDLSLVWCEKPIASSVRRADEMVAACEEAGVELVVNHSRRFSKAFRTLRDLLHEETFLGEPQSAHLVWGGDLLNVGTHFVDLLLYLLDAEVKDVRGGRVEATRTDDGVRFSGGGTLTMNDGTSVHVDPVPGSTMRLYIEGTEGRLSAPLNVAPDADHRWEYWRVEERSRTRTTLPEPLEEYWKADISGLHSTYEPGMVPAQTMFERTVSDLVAVLDGQVPNRSPGTAAVHGLEILTGIVLSEYTGSRISLPLETPFRELPLTTL